jgi:lipoprotein-releasing system permease protein
LEVLAQNQKAPLKNPEQAFNKTDLIPVGIYTINEDLDSKYVLHGLAKLLEYKPIKFLEN